MLSWLPENVSSYGHQIDGIIQLITYIVGAWFILAEGVLLFFIFRYRRKEGGRATYATGSTLRSLAWILVPGALILAFDLGIDFAQGPVWDRIKLEIPEEIEQTVRIEGQQFVWNITHPGKDGQLDTADDIITMNQMTVPVHAKIRFELQAKDVLHSLWLPHLRLKQDAVPGRTIPGWFEVTRAGTFPIACAELCGSGHGIMRGQLHVLEREDYDKWVAENSPTAEESTE